MDHPSRENLDSFEEAEQHIGEDEGRMIPHIYPSISELECRLKAGISPAEFCADGVARIDAKLHSPLGGRADGLERLAEMQQMLGEMQQQMDKYGTVLDAKLDAAVYQILAKVDQRIDRMPKCHYAASPSSVEQTWDTPDTGEKRRFVLKLQPLE